MERINERDRQKPRPRPKGTSLFVSEPMDLPFALLVVLLSCIGLVMMFSASYAAGANTATLGATYFVSRQGAFVVIGVCAMLLISRLNYEYFHALAYPLMLVALALLVLVLIIGTVINGARRWIDLGFTTIQPSEIAKIAVIMLFATRISREPDGLRERRFVPLMKKLAYYLVTLGIIVVLLYLEPHNSAIVMIVAIGCVMLFIGGLAWRYILAVGGTAVVGMGAIILFTDYARARIEHWQHPELDPLGGGYQIIQSLYAIGSGGWFGVGLGQSRQKHLYLPEPQNDFVFAIVVEELGYIGAIGILMLFMLLIVRGYWIALHAKDQFGALLVGGVTTLLAIQTFLNVAVVTNLIPVTGISMPFFSYGGTALLIQLAEMGIILAVSRQIRPATAPEPRLPDVNGDED